MLAMYPIALHGVPRSGTSWLGHIFSSSPHVLYRYQPLFSYAFKGRLGPTSSREEVLGFFEDLIRTTDDFVLQRDPKIHVDRIEHADSPVATHLVYKEVRYHHILPNLMHAVPQLRTVVLVRHPCAVIDSWMNSPREFKPEWDVNTQWYRAELKNQDRPEEYFGFERWKEAAKLFLELERDFPDRAMVVRYADLNSDPVSVVKEIFAFCDIPYGEQTEKFIQESCSRDGGDPYSVFRTSRPDDNWHWRLPKRISEDILHEVGASDLAKFLA